MSSLMELTNEYKTLAEWAEDPDVDQQTLTDTMESVIAELKNKVDAYVVLIARLENNLDLRKRAVKALQDDNKRLKANIDRIKDMAMQAMQTMGERKLEGELYKMRIQNNGGIQPMQVDEDKVPDSYKRIVYETDSDKIRKELTEGKNLDFARLLPRGESLQGDWTKLRAKKEEKEGEDLSRK